MLNLFCIILYITFGPNHWLEVHKCPYLQNCIQGRCWNTELSKSLLNWCWNTEVAAQPEDAYAETRSCYTVRGCRRWNTKLSHSSELQMLKHRGDHHDAETWALTISSQGRHSQECNSRGWNNLWIAMLKQHQQLWKEVVTPAVTAMPRSAPVLADRCVRIGHPILI
jgi:hypothetical protein